MRKRTIGDWIEDNGLLIALSPWGALLTFRIIQNLVHHGT